jgi:hypothetical protein
VSKRILNVLGGLSIAGIAVLCWFTWFSADDICYRNELARYGVFEKAWLQYLHWDGRSLSVASILQLAFLKYLPAPVITFAWVCAFTGNAILIQKILRLENSGAGPQRISVISTGLLSAVLWLGLWKLVPDILYWPTGGWYCVMCLLGLCWILVLLRDLRAKRFSAQRALFIFLCSLLCGNNSQNLVIALFLLGLVELMHAHVFHKDRKAVVHVFAALSGLLAGASVVFFAPGNAERLKAIGWQGFDSSFLYNCIIVLARYFYWLAALIALLLLVVWLGHKKAPPGTNKFNGRFHFKAILHSKQSFVAALHSHKYLVAAFSTVIAFSATSFFAVPRTAIFFGMFITLYALQKGNAGMENAGSRRFIIGSATILMLSVSVMVYEIAGGYSLKKKISVRQRIFDNNKGKDVVADEIESTDIPFAYNFTDITSDTSYWVNRCVALNQGLKTVRIRQR